MKEKETKAFKILLISLKRSLDRLGIEPKRYSTLPIRQLKLALRQAVFYTTRELTSDIHWLFDRLDFYDKELWDFSPTEIEKHQVILDSLIALVCLGETNYAHSLVTYLGFPEPRWKILISSVLKAVNKEYVRGPLFDLPTYEEISSWRKWSIKSPAQEKMRDFSDLLLEEFDVSNFILYRFSTKGNSNAALQNESKLTYSKDKRLYDDRQALICKNILLPYLDDQNFEGFTLRLNKFVKTTDKRISLDTLVMSIIDILENTQPSTNAIVDYWLSTLSWEKVDIQTIIYMFKISKNLLPNRESELLLNKFSEKIIIKSDIDNAEMKQIVLGILTEAVDETFLLQVARKYADLNELQQCEKEFMLSMKPFVKNTWVNVVRDMVLKETENICIVGSEARNRRRKLILDFKKVYSTNSRTLHVISIAKNSPESEINEFGKFALEFSEQRNDMSRHFLDWKKFNTKIFGEEYLRIVEEVLSNRKTIYPLLEEVIHHSE